MKFIFINGEQTEYRPGLSLFDLLQMHKLVNEKLGVEKNDEIIPQSRYKAVFLEPGDKVEIVRFIGGG